MRDSLMLYFKYIIVSLRSQLQYRASFIMFTLGNFATSIIDFFGIWVLFDRFGSLMEWTLPEVALFYGIVHMAFAISEAWSRGFDMLHRYVQSGDFDRILLRPRSTVLQVLGAEFQLMRVGRLVQGLLVLVWAIGSASISWSIGKAILLIASVLGGALLFSGLFVLQATLSFWSVQSLEIANVTTYGGVEAAQLPITIYGSWFRRFFIYIIPLATINYFPAMAILGKTDPLGSAVFAQWLSPLAGVLFFAVTLQFWKIGLKRYASTGS